MIQNRSVPFGPGKGLKRNTPFLALHKLNSLQEPNMDQHRPNIGSIYEVAPSLSGATATCSMATGVVATGVVTTQQSVPALLTTVTMRATRKSENMSEELLSL